jgi:O-antigen/teichoic acid export membrane protein
LTETAPILALPTQGPSALSRRLRALSDMRGLWSLGDQAILSLGNFLIGWLLLRSQTAWFGNYFTILSVLLFLNNLHMAMVTYPISVTSAGISDSELRRRVRRAILMTLVLLVPESMAICVGTVTTVGWHLVPFVIAALAFWQLQETTRRSLMARLEHRRAILGDAVSYLGQAACVWFVLHHGSITIEMAFTIIAVTSAAAMLIQGLQLKLQVPSDSPPVHSLKHQARHHISLGQWILLLNALDLLSIPTVTWIIRYFHGPSVVALYAAALWVLKASNPLQASVANLITPVVAKLKAEAHARGDDGLGQARMAALKYSAQGALLLFPFFGFLIAFPTVALRIFYRGGSPYLALGTPVRIFAIAYGFMYLSAMINSYLCGLGKSRLPFIGQSVNAIVTCLITLPLVAKFGVAGAAWGGMFPVIAQVAIGIYFVKHAQDHLSRRPAAGF